MKNAFFYGMGMGVVLGTYLMRHCPSVREAFDSAEDKVESVIHDCKQKMQKKNQQPQSDAQ